MIRRLLPCVLAGALLGAGPAWAAPGDRDETFSRDGLVRSSELGPARAVDVQPDGAIVAGGAIRASGDRTNPFLARYLPDGSLDPEFAEGGVSTFDLGAHATADDVFVAPDGKIIAAGFVGSGGFDGDFFALRVLADGSLDPSFAGDGSTRVDFGGFFDSYAAAALQEDGRILLVGSGFDGTGDPHGSIAVARLEPDGDLDPTFSGDGRLLLDLGDTPAHANAVVARPNGSILLAGTTAEPFSDRGDVFVLRLQPNGDVEPTFGDGGIALADFGFGDLVSALAVAPDGRIVVAGDTCTIDLLRFRCLAIAGRFAADGSLDGSFAGDGTVVFGDESPLHRVGAARALERQPDGGVVIGGTVDEGEPFGSDFALRRLTAEGAPDGGWSGDGLVATDFDLSGDGSEDLAIAPDGRIVVVGGELREDLELARYEVGAGPPDADADGFLDDTDGCAQRFAGHRTGCPRIERELEVRRRGHQRLRGRLEAETRSCASRQRVKIYRVEPGADEQVARTKTRAGALGRWKIGRALGDGRHYAVARRDRDPGIGRCAKVKSRRIRI